ncbi:Bug family tripartite tricarboxylate transporter substrate binding protein [Azohydromonas lata]|uniref:Tripartite tricarboxylate transporter substrate binding protein n=1 Tax=Azohydromonas lata TaxID=45677 RepID=A0ABU5IQM9_9BURK|nr:tripartite tricarboxylate transporter substrate binding protein [Azohydromonas lata]MDZ5461191.1 tripartite tricarboxylate transporter substrate binding protein [Azohydromonas lata]
MLRKLAAAAIAATALAVAGLTPARADTYPSKPIRLVVPYAAGGNADITARVIARRMSEGLGQPIVIDNRGGANGGIGTDAVAKAAPDGYTLLMTASGPIVVNPVLYAKVPYDPVRDLQPVSQILTYQYALVVPAAAPFHSVNDLVNQARAHPGTLTYGSAGIGAGGHLAGEMLAWMTKTKLTHVPYKGNAPALNDVLGNVLAFTFDTVTTAAPHIRNGSLRPLAVSGPRRAGALPQVPTLQELGYKGFNVTQFVGLLAPAKTDPDIVRRLHQEVVKALKAPEVIERLQVEGGNDLVGSSPEAFAATIAQELAMYRKLVTDARIQQE